ncbi:MAG: alpha/beta fold hydrolase [Gemmatimonadota bacterium]|nr:alpha/beta fold hydrolase [Gemmatimonadota bacterium]
MPAPIPPPRDDGFTSTTQTPLYWARYGASGTPALLVLHGGPGAHHDYLLPQLLQLADRYELVFYDQRGGGRSRTDDREAIGWRTHVADLAAVARELGLDPLSLVGYSWGGLLAMLYALEAARDETVPAPHRLVLIDPAPATREHRRAFETELARRQAAPAVQAMRDELAASGLRERDPQAFRQRKFEIGVAGYFADPRRASDLTPFRVMGRVQQSVWESLGEFDLLPDLGEIRVPTLILHGQQDPIPLAASEETARRIPNARLVVLEGSGHVPYVEAEVALFRTIRRFLDATAQRAIA